MLEERKVKKAKVSLMRNKRFALLSGILMVGKTYVDDITPTARTNGRDEWYGREFVKQLKDPELMFVMAHEASHKMYRHLSVWRKLYDENPRLANCACDYVINLMLTKLDPEGKFISMPRMGGKVVGLIDKRFEGMNAKQVFDILKKESEREGEGEGEGEGDGDGNGDRFDDHDWESGKSLNQEERRQLDRDIDQAIRQGLMAQKQFGSGTGGGDRELGELLEPKINWREVLREFVKATCNGKDTSSWRKVNRRFLSSGGVYMPSLIGEKVGNIVIAVDTSGSIGGDELAEFLSEVKGIAEEVNPEKVDLLYWGSSVVSHEEYEGNNVSSITTSTKPKDGGGTDPVCVENYIEKNNIKPECIVVLTDGYVPSWGSSWNAPILWAITGGNDAVADTGKTIHIKD